MIGILPAAGRAERFQRLPKYAFPVNGTCLLNRHIDMMRSVADYGIYIATSGTNWDVVNSILSYGDAIDVGYTETMSETILRLQRYTRSEGILFGMPDTYIENSIFPPNHDLEHTNIYQRMAMKLDAGADLVVGIFPAREDQKSHVGMVDVKATEHGYIVIECVDKPEQTGLHYGWGTLGWKPIFWQFIKPEDPHVGYAIPRAIEAGLDIRTATMHSYWDCGTPERYFALIRHLTEER